tara:strand:- start:1308 stop:2330 length:1023 start_codon:yes stop_codon:yes gene_type:complete
MYRILVTGGVGFIGGALITRLLKNESIYIFNIDKLSKESNLHRNNQFKQNKRYVFYHTDLLQRNDLNNILKESKPNLIIHLAAESHVDRSLTNPIQFIESNIIGTVNLLEASKKYWENLSNKEKLNFKFYHISTDEVYGSLNNEGQFSESSRYDPRSPYSASKASSDHLVKAWYHSFSLPILISNCSNNYGPYQFHEKLIPHTISKALNEENIPLYGDGKNIRDWIYIEDHIDAILLIANKGNIGEQYCIGGNCEKKNIDVILEICELMDLYLPKSYPHKNLIKFVADRAGHDKRYSIDNYKINSELGWHPKYSFKNGLDETVKWFINNQPLWINSFNKK